jgi:CubicO group peptidase (beta-lactamase class C family)
MPISVSTSKTCRSGASAIVIECDVTEPDVIESRATSLRQLRAIAAILCVMLAGCASGDMRAAAGIDDLLRPYVGSAPGASVLVIRDGVPLLRRSYGLADLEKKTAATPQTNYRLASVTKQFTASAILLLAEDDKLTLDDRIRKWLPTLPDTDEAITIRHLLTHTGGLIDYEDIIPDAPAASAPPTTTGGVLPPTSDEVVDDPSRQLRDIDVLHLLEKERRLYFKPGSDYRYSNGGYSMLALIVERASGKTFQDFLHERIFEKLGMHDTLAYVAEGPPVPHRAYGYTETKGTWRRTDQSLTSAVLGDGGIYSSIDDLAKWDAASYDNRLLSDASRRVAFTPWTKTDDASVQYGFGIRLTGETQWHSGETIGFRNVIVRYPKRHLTVIVLTNRDDPEPYRMALAIAQHYLEP